MRLALASDAWAPQVNGVVRALMTTVSRLERRDISVEPIVPGAFRTVPCPTYPEIRLALNCRREVALRLSRFAPDAVHIATEGPIGWAARGWCLANRMPFTTSFHTRFPDYVALRTGAPAGWIWPLIRRFHAPAKRTMAVTQSLADELARRGFPGTHVWPLGVDTLAFGPKRPLHTTLASLPRPILLNVGRVAVEKNLPAFLMAEVPGTKVVVGDGPALEQLRQRFPQTLFVGPKHGAELAAIYASADVFVFPSRTDTFGLVNIEALASGLPIAAFPVEGPRDILGPDGRGLHGGQALIGHMSEDLSHAIEIALRQGSRAGCASEAAFYDWERCTDRFLDGLALKTGLHEALAA